MIYTTPKLGVIQELELKEFLGRAVIQYTAEAMETQASINIDIDSLVKELGLRMKEINQDIETLVVSIGDQVYFYKEEFEIKHLTKSNGFKFEMRKSYNE